MVAGATSFLWPIEVSQKSYSDPLHCSKKPFIALPSCLSAEILAKLKPHDILILDVLIWQPRAQYLKMWGSDEITTGSKILGLI